MVYMNDELEVLFDSKTKPKVLKLFFQNEGVFFNLKEVSKKCQVSRDKAKREVRSLQKIKLLQVKTQKGKKIFSLNPKFIFLNEIRSMIFRASPLYLGDLKKLFRKDKKIKLVAVSGVFLQEERSPVDILIVGDRIKKSRLSPIIKKLESEVGKEIKWSLMPQEEFDYRFKMHDRFLKDVFDHAHKRIIDKLKI